MNFRLLPGLVIAVFGTFICAEEKPAPPAPAPKNAPVVIEGRVETFEPLYALEFDEKTAPSSFISLKETKRNPKTSIVVVKAKPTPYADNGAGMIMVGAMQQMALNRGAKFMIILQSKKVGEDREFLLGFSDAKEPDPAKFFELSAPVPKAKWMDVVGVRPPEKK